MALKIFHNAGFFSCCSVKLDEIINYFNINKKLPEIVDSSEQYSWYKTHEYANKDITYEYFVNNTNNDDDIVYTKKINYTQNDQFSSYATIDYDSITPFIKKYFTPSDDVANIINVMEDKYNITDYSNICVLFYRGNDKITETSLCSYEKIIEKANQIALENPSVIFLIQSDETEFINVMKGLFKNSIHFKDETRDMNKCCSTVDIVFKESNFIYSKFYLAITVIMSKCKYIVCGSSGNCSIWITFYRGNANNVYQYLNNELL